MKEQFVSLAIAQQLKEKGFDQSCMAYVYTGDTGTNVDQYVYGAISHDGNPRYENYNAPDMSYSLPLWQQVIDWLREKHDIDVMIKQIKLDGTAYYKITKIETEDKIKGYSDFCKSTYEAKEKAIKQALTLI